MHQPAMYPLNQPVVLRCGQGCMPVLEIRLTLTQVATVQPIESTNLLFIQAKNISFVMDIYASLEPRISIVRKKCSLLEVLYPKLFRS